MSNQSYVFRSQDEQMAHLENIPLIPMCFHYTCGGVARHTLKEVRDFVRHRMSQNVCLLVVGGNSADLTIEDCGVILVE